MKPHADAVAIVLMLGDTPDEQQIRDAFAEAGIDRYELQLLETMGYIKFVGRRDTTLAELLNTVESTVEQYKVTPKGLELLE